MTLEEFEAKTLPILETRTKIETNRSQLRGLLRERDHADEELKATLSAVTNAVRAMPQGEDSPLYRALGFIPKSERGSGLTRRGRQSDVNAA